MKKIIAFARSHYPFFWAAVVLLTGFLAMLGWWCFGTHCEEPGFFYYRAATYGDAIGLTLLVFACGRYCQQAMKDKQQEIEHDMIKHLPIVVAVIVGFFFFAWQVEWLVEADTNWTLVRRSEPISFLGIQMRNRFTGAGYWHAAFFVGAGALISYFFM